MCLPAAVMSRKHLLTLEDLLDRTLAFSWTDNEQFMVLPLCNYFLLDETYILPISVKIFIEARIHLSQQ